MSKITIDAKYDLGDIVYKRVCDDKQRGMITIISINPGNVVKYCVEWANSCNWYYDIELSKEYVPDFNAFNKDN